MLTEATRGENVPELWEKIEAHRAFLEDGGRARAPPARQNLAGEVFARRLRRGRRRTSSAPVEGDPELRRLLDEVQRRELDPLTAVREILEKVFQVANGNRPDPR